jgi:hypothetical protein
MPAQKPTLHFAFMEGEPGVESTPDGELAWREFQIQDWTKIENAYGCDLPKPVRSEINYFTWLYLLGAQGEQAAVPVSEVTNLIGSVRRAAEELRAELLQANQLHHGAAAAILESISEGHSLKIEAVSSFVRRCELAEAELKNSTLPGHVVGEAWDRWVRELATILTKYGLPAEAGKNRDGPGEHKTSKFTALVIALQECLPDKYQRPFNSGPALTKAIHRALRPIEILKENSGGHVSPHTQEE